MQQTLVRFNYVDNAVGATVAPLVLLRKTKELNGILKQKSGTSGHIFQQGMSERMFIELRDKRKRLVTLDIRNIKHIKEVINKGL